MRSRIQPFRFRSLAALGGLVLALAACSSSGASSAPSAAASAAGPSAAAASAPAGSAAAGGEVYAVEVANGAAGAYLTGEDGKTLYVFTPDSKNTSTCLDACAGNWPPFTIEEDDTLKGGTGVTGTLATFARPDGKLQVTVNGLPLYYYAADAKAGDATGQGKGGKWFVAPVDGVLPSAAPSSALRY
jgi:predicted lipoprotein with Yx(FWY)xxD motif